MSGNGYDGYRGRTRAQRVARIVAGVVLILLVLVVVGLILGQRYIVYTDDGIRLELPFLQEQEPPAPDVGDVSVQIVQRPDSGDETPGKKTDGPVRAGFADPEALDGQTLQALKGQGVNTLVLDMKRDDGSLAYQSGLDLAQKEAEDSGAVTRLLEEIHRLDMRAVARISCFRDDTLGRREEYALLTNSGYRWNYDQVGLYWTDPADPSVQEYLAGVVGELAILGFDEVLLDNCGYPTQGELGWIRRGEGFAPQAAVERFLALVTEKTQGTHTLVSLYADAQVLDGTDTRSGCTPALLAGLEGRIWLRGEGLTEQIALASGLPAQRLVWPGGSFDRERHTYLIPQ